MGLAASLAELAKSLTLRGLCALSALGTPPHRLGPGTSPLGWSHELLINFYSSSALPELYAHQDLCALTLLLVPIEGGAKLRINHEGAGRSIEFRTAFLPSSRRHSVAARYGMARGLRRMAAVALPGSRLSEA